MWLEHRDAWEKNLRPNDPPGTGNGKRRNNFDGEKKSVQSHFCNEDGVSSCESDPSKASRCHFYNLSCPNDACEAHVAEAAARAAQRAAVAAVAILAILFWGMQGWSELSSLASPHTAVLFSLLAHKTQGERALRFTLPRTCQPSPTLSSHLARTSIAGPKRTAPAHTSRRMTYTRIAPTRTHTGPSVFPSTHHAFRRRRPGPGRHPHCRLCR